VTESNAAGHRDMYNSKVSDIKVGVRVFDIPSEQRVQWSVYDGMDRISCLVTEGPLH
jgi:hypothetical protein